MSVNNVRRHRSPATWMNLNTGRTERVVTLLALRDYLSTAAAVYEAHDLDGADDICIEQWGIESAIRALAPHVYEERWTDWLERDVEFAHTPGQPHPRCHICTMNQAAA